jgi:spore maturation protein CgeB
MAKPLKILIPNFPAADSFTDNVSYTLAVMGHEARTMPRLAIRDRGRVRRVFSDAWSAYFPDTWSSQERWSVDTAKNWVPDIVLALTLALRDEVLSELKRLGAGSCVAWWGDTPANMRRMGLLSEGWDAIYIKDAAAVAKFRAVGLPAAVMHEAMNPDWHKPYDGPDGADADAVVVAGNFYGYRQVLIDKLAQKSVPLALYGTRPPRWSSQAVHKHFRGRYIVKEEKSRIFAGSLACLNSTSLSEGNSLNCRAFEICGASGLQLIENKPAVRSCFEPGREVLTYDTVDDIIEHLDRARREPDWARSIRESGHNRALSEHTYRLRLERILKEAGYSSAHF